MLYKNYIVTYEIEKTIYKDIIKDTTLKTIIYILSERNNKSYTMINILELKEI